MKTTRNLWPWGIIFTFVVFIAGTASLVVMACSQKVDLVSTDYYEQEIRFQHHLDNLGRTRDQNQQATIAYDRSVQHVNISLPPGQAGKVVKGLIVLYRPSAADLDRSFQLEPNEHGLQVLDGATLLPGLWRARVSWTCASQEFFTEQTFIAGTAKR